MYKALWNSMEHFDAGDFITGTDGIDDIQPFNDLSEAGMIPVQVRGILAGVADEELGSAGIPAGMCHGKHTTVVILIVARQFAFDAVTRTACTGTVRTTALDYEVRYHTVECKPVVVSFFG